MENNSYALVDTKTGAVLKTGSEISLENYKDNLASYRWASLDIIPYSKESMERFNKGISKQKRRGW